MIINLPFCEMHFHDNYVICVIENDIDFNTEQSKQQTQEILKYFGDKPFVYITNRINSYSVNPYIYVESSQIKNLVGFAVISKNSLADSNAEIEQLFLKKPFKIFRNIKDAKLWANEKIKILE